MTKKHFIQLAAALKYERPGAHWDANKIIQWELDVCAVASVCAKNNPSFDKGRFLAACGYPATKERS